jgi:hypothetical protein
MLVGAVLGVQLYFGVRQHLRARDRREQESLGVKALYEEMDAALRSVNMAARNTDSRWVAGLSESRTLAETWIAHGPAFKRLDMARWETLDDAVKAVEPIYGLELVRPSSDPLQPSLVERQERLRRGMDVLRGMLQLDVASRAEGAPARESTPPPQA